MQAVYDEPNCFDSFMAHYGKFTNVSNYIAIVGAKNDQEKAGYYGEKLVLPKDPERKNAEFLGWFTEATGGTQVGCLSLAGGTGFSLIGEADSRTD